MEKIKLITGEKAEEVLEEQKKKLNKHYKDKYVFNVIKLPVEVAAFITKEMVKKVIEKEDDYVIVPGTVSFDFSELQNVYKGPKNAYDVYDYLKKDINKLSPKKSAEEVIDISKRYKDQFKEFAEKSSYQLKIKELEIGKEKPMKVAAEVVDSTNKKKKELIKEIKYYESQKADLIDLGVSISSYKEDLRETISTAKQTTSLPLSVDTTDPELIKTAIDSGIDLILSITWGNYEALKDDLDGINCVVAARDNLNELIEKTKDFGANSIADPILDPPNKGLTDSLKRYKKFSERDKEIPIFFGAGNVTEMIDADSQGVNALLAAIASELDVSILFTPEASSKTNGSVRELKKSTELMYLSKINKTTPKDFDVDLLFLKEKKRKEIEPKLSKKMIKAKENQKYQMDKGYFEIGLDRDKKEIIAVFYLDNEKTPSLTIRGNSAKAINDTIKEKELVNEMGHAFYLGRELQKAETALKTGKNYNQDQELFELLYF